MISRFSFPTNVVFGAGSLKELPAAMEELGVNRPLVVTDRGIVQTSAFQLLQSISNARWPVFSSIHPNPIEEDVVSAAEAYRVEGCDGVIGFGGGSALDVAKILRVLVRRPSQPLALFDSGQEWKGLPAFVAVPTTAGTGSEVGRSSVVILEKQKRVFFHPALLASRVVLDPELTRGLPPHLTAATGADALTHCIESFTSPVFHPLCDGIALEGLRLIHQALARVVSNGDDLHCRGLMMIGAMMGGIAFQKDLGATHSLAHPLSSLCGLHHGTANALCLRAVMEFNAERKPGLYRRLAAPLELKEDTDQAVISKIGSLLEEIGLSSGLATHGVKETDLEKLADQAVQDSCHLTNPVPVSRRDFQELYQQCL